MSIDLRGLRVFVASPGGLENERDRFRDVLREYSEQDAHDRGVAFIPVGWENTRAGVGRPQSLINAQIESCDFLLLILHERWGSPPGDSPIGADFTSGTEEEFALAMKLVKEAGKAMVDVAVLFKHVDPTRLADPGAQLQKVIDFKKKLERERAVLYWTFGSTDEFEKRLRQLLLEWIRLPERSLRPASPLTARAIEAVCIGEISTAAPDDMESSSAAESHSPLVRRAIALADEGRLVEAEQGFARATQDAADLDAQLEFGKFLQRLGRWAEAEAVFQSLTLIARRRNDAAWESRGLLRLAGVAFARGDLASASRSAEAALDIAQSAGSTVDTAACMGNLGVIEETRGNVDAAEVYLRKSLSLNEKLGRNDGVANVYSSLGAIEAARGNVDAAEGYHLKAMALYERLGRQDGMASEYGNLGLIELARGNLDAAESYQKKALAINEKLGRQEGVASGCGNLGLIEETRGNLGEARRLWVQARDLFRKIGAKDREARVQALLDGLK